MKFEQKNLEISFHKLQVSFLVVKTVKCKRSNSLSFPESMILHSAIENIGLLNI